MAINFADDRLFVTYSFTDETSQFDPEGFWAGIDCFLRRYYCRVPRKIVNDKTKRDAFIDQHLDDIDSGFWVDGPASPRALGAVQTKEPPHANH